jgi:hypothetical protein
MVENQKSVVYELEEINREIIVLFRDTPIIEDETLFKRSHYFKNLENTSITTIFKDELVKLFNVNSVKELKEKIDNKIRLMFKVGTGDMTYDEKTNTVFVYMESFKNDVVKPAKDISKLKKVVERLYKKEKVCSEDIVKVTDMLVKGIEDNLLKEKDKKIIAEMIPILIKNGNIKISLKDVTDINKDRLKDIIQLGRDLISKKNGVEKKLGIDKKYIGKEYAWQRYFELYGSYLLFGSIEQQIPQAAVRLNSELRSTNSNLDLLTINRYGFLDVVELKRSDDYLFKIDESHDNIVPTSKLSTAISQVNNYLMLLPYSEGNGELVKGAESATGMLVIGTHESLMKKEHINKYIEKTGKSIESVNLKLRKALRDLNYSYAHIEIVLYDELLNNLENFLNQMSVETNI